MKGYPAIALEDGRQAIDALRAIKPDLLLSNVLLGLSGTDIARHARADPSHHSVPITLMSAGKVSPAEFDGCIGFVEKPFDMALC
jgi:DNA-binding response OmpR family regulator